ncbi:hypothetical protein HSR121_1811 [Halapricum desulfuricans]|uniref:Uncharacterized protein n=1 Tax=Halapricum desulfuricans TaxID=2841257 RepID=A0A897N5D6_9EURY|nr:hypothetical protein HSR121_1811 [Halapricum desulfuricans]
MIREKGFKQCLNGVVRPLAVDRDATFVVFVIAVGTASRDCLRAYMHDITKGIGV